MMPRPAAAAETADWAKSRRSTAIAANLPIEIHASLSIGLREPGPHKLLLIFRA
jgi:hypothetical protein